MSARRTSTRRFSIRILIPFLAIPITAATIAPRSQVDRESVGIQRSNVLHPISRVIEHSSDWHVVARYERPQEDTWAIVAWHDSPVRPGQMDPSEIVVLEQNPIADALIITTYYREAGPCDPVEVDRIADERFLDSLRHDLRYCSRTLSSSEDIRSIDVVRAMLKKRVRKLNEPSVSLTSAFE